MQRQKGARGPLGGRAHGVAPPTEANAAGPPTAFSVLISSHFVTQGDAHPHLRHLLPPPPQTTCAAGEETETGMSIHSGHPPGQRVPPLTPPPGPRRPESPHVASDSSQPPPGPQPGHRGAEGSPDAHGGRVPPQTPVPRSQAGRWPPGQGSHPWLVPSAASFAPCLFVPLTQQFSGRSGTECSRRIAQVSVCFGQRFIYVICEGEWRSSHILGAPREPGACGAQGGGGRGGGGRGEGRGAGGRGEGRGKARKLRLMPAGEPGKWDSAEETGGSRT